MNYQQKYLKYKHKYSQLKNSTDGGLDKQRATIWLYKNAPLPTVAELLYKKKWIPAERESLTINVSLLQGIQRGAKIPQAEFDKIYELYPDVLRIKGEPRRKLMPSVILKYIDTITESEVGDEKKIYIIQFLTAYVELALKKYNEYNDYTANMGIDYVDPITTIFMKLDKYIPGKNDLKVNELKKNFLALIPQLEEAQIKYERENPDKTGIDAINTITIPKYKVWTARMNISIYETSTK